MVEGELGHFTQFDIYIYIYIYEKIVIINKLI